MEDNKQNQKPGANQETREELRDNGGSQNASGSRGGTTDLGEDALTVDRGSREERGSGSTTKNTVAGSDFDGQVA